MKKALLWSLLLFLSVGIYAQASQNKNSMIKNKQQWEAVQQFENESLPKSANKIVDEILKKAIADSDTPQVIKALIYKNKYKVLLDEQQYSGIFTDLEGLLLSTDNEADKALLHSMLAELYFDCYQTNSWAINQRTNLADFVPDDIKEWTSNVFFDKVFSHLKESVKNKNLLLSKPTEQYVDIINMGSDSRKLSPSLYDFLMMRAIEKSKQLNSFQNKNKSLKTVIQQKGIVPKDLLLSNAKQFIEFDFSGDDNLFTLELYREYLESLLKRDLKEAIVLTEISRNDYQSLISSEFSYDFLLALEKQYRAYDFDVEVISALINREYANNRIHSKRGGNAQDTVSLKKIYDWYNYGIEKYPNYSRINILKSGLADMERPLFNTDSRGVDVFHPASESQKIGFEYRNLDKVQVKIVKLDDNGNEAATTYKTIDVVLDGNNTYTTYKKEIDLGIDDAGSYNIYFTFDKKPQHKNDLSVHVSRLISFCRIVENNKYEFYVVDRLTGVPVEGAEIAILKDNKLVDKLVSDAKGFAGYVSKENLNEDYSLLNTYKYRVSYRGDKSLLEYRFPMEYRLQSVYMTPKNTQTESIQIFTDRSIYRPGQILYFKAVAFGVANQEYTAPIANKSYEVELFDVNGQPLAKKTLKTDEFGSVAGEFVLPQSGLTGSYYLKVGDQNLYFSVEEYKRPTFEVKFDKVDKTYSFGDKVKIKGYVLNFSGIKLQGAIAEYTITKRNWWWFTDYNNNQVDAGEVITGDDGSFEIEFTIPADDKENILPYWRNISSFDINVSVTDSNGETQSNNYSLAVGDVSMLLSTNIGDKLDKGSDQQIDFKATNLNGYEIETQGTYKVFSLNENDSIKAEVLKGDFKTGQQQAVKEKLAKLPSGKYKIKLFAKDSNSKDVESETDFVLYSNSDKQPPIKTNEWLIVKSLSFDKSKSTEIILGISAKETVVLYELMRGSELFERQQLKYSNQNRTFVISYKSEYENGVSAVFTYVVDGQIYQHVFQIEKDVEQNNLNLKFEVFRDKLRTGQHEEWRISVKDNAGKPVLAEMLALMYDASLDKLQGSRPLSIQVLGKFFDYPIVFQANRQSRGGYFSYSFDTPSYKYTNYSFDQLDWFGFSFNLNSNLGLYKQYAPSLEPALAGGITSMVSSQSARKSEGAALKDVIANESVIAAEIDELAQLEDSESASQIRSNFNETAFFYPQLKTDKNGETIISFVVPESNTTWNFQALAYDKSVNWGTLSASVVSRKELMVTPNMPRFVRQGDKTSISTKISNMSEGTIAGKVRLELFDPLTDKLLDIQLSDPSQEFNLDKDASSSALWLFEVPDGIDMIGCRIVAESANFSDGEQHVLSVLPNRMLVTESMSIDVTGKRVKEFTFDKLIDDKSTTRDNYKLTLEYTSNPAWYAVQALLVLSNPTNQNAVNWFASYYVNTLGASIMKRYPRVAPMIEAWKKQDGSKETLISKLEKNQELKSVLLEETPWVFEAGNETEQMERLSLLFDLNNSAMQTRIATDKLRELQNADGSWSWYKGMYPSRSITQYILYGLTQLVKLGAVEYPTEVREMYMSALKYVDSQIKDDFKRLKESNTDWKNLSGISTTQLEYLYVRSAYRDIPIDQEAREAERFYTSVVEKHWSTLNLYEKSLMVVLANQNGNKVLAEKILKSIKEYATENNEMGMFWANNRSSVFMSMSAVSAHTFIMEAFNELKASIIDMDKMKQWLLKQKQTQQWDSCPATIDAIYALLSTGADWFAQSGDSKVFVGGELIEPRNKELGTGYIEESWSKNQIKPGMGNVKIEKTDEGPAWGALYIQYYETLDKITDQKGVLNVDKKLFVEKNMENGKSLVQVTDANRLRVGDKVVVRLTVRVDRDMEFVHLKDMRASCFEPVETLSGLRWQDRQYYYQSIKDASTNYFFDHLAKGTYIFEYSVYVNRVGEYSNGITTIQCMYAPEFVSHTKGIIVNVD